MVEILEKKALCIPLVKEALKKIEKRDGELNFRANRTMEYVNEAASLSPTKAKELIKKIEDLNLPRLKPEHIHKIVDILPRSEKQLKVVLQGYTLTVSLENQKKIMKILQEYLPKK
ncbi:hypothetical protein D6789_03560 [Candidatus Woesearchaeota archaeon]|nr:MAG: hypothetical protein D6789_03560 [Candidatus Woesearchaeota archaeon]